MTVAPSAFTEMGMSCVGSALNKIRGNLWLVVKNGFAQEQEVWANKASFQLNNPALTTAWKHGDMCSNT